MKASKAEKAGKGMVEGMEIARRAYVEIGLKPFTKIPPEKKEAYQKAKGRQRYLYLTEKLPKISDGTPRKPLTREETLERDRQWGKKHRHDTDEELLEYLRRTAKELGYTPPMREVIGGHYIEQRFCGWGVAVTLAGLPLGKNMKPTAKQMQMYENRRANRAKMKAEAKAPP